MRSRISDTWAATPTCLVWFSSIDWGLQHSDGWYHEGRLRWSKPPSDGAEKNHSTPAILRSKKKIVSSAAAAEKKKAHAVVPDRRLPPGLYSWQFCTKWESGNLTNGGVMGASLFVFTFCILFLEVFFFGDFREACVWNKLANNSLPLKGTIKQHQVAGTLVILHFCPKSDLMLKKKTKDF